MLVGYYNLDLSISRQCELLGLASVYPHSLQDLYSGSRLMVDYLPRDATPISYDRLRIPMIRVGLLTTYHNRRTTVPGDPSGGTRERQCQCSRSR